jgi:hypothetical protein
VGIDSWSSHDLGLDVIADGLIIFPTGWRLLWAPAWWAVWRAIARGERFDVDVFGL